MLGIVVKCARVGCHGAQASLLGAHLIGFQAAFQWHSRKVDFGSLVTVLYIYCKRLQSTRARIAN
jgi:hypothetical protein